MLTKQEREKIAERFVSYDSSSMYFSDIYKYLFGKDVPTDTLSKDDHKAVIARLIDLCDTSNMVELPLDKDGVSFKMGDTVYDSNNKQYKVNGYVFVNDCWKIIVAFSSESSFASIYTNDLTHKKPVTIASLVSDIKRVANQGRVDRKVYEELFRIAWALESLGDSDD